MFVQCTAAGCITDGALVSRVDERIPESRSRWAETHDCAPFFQAVSMLLLARVEYVSPVSERVTRCCFQL